LKFGNKNFKFYRRKFAGPYDYRFNNSRMLDAARNQPVAQKKHQMYGKRFANESAILPPPAIQHPHASIAPTESIPNIPLKYEPYENYNLDAGQSSSAASSSVIKPPSSMMDSEMKYSYSLDFPSHQRLKSGSGNGISAHELINHNHTYTMMPPHHPGPQLLNNNGANPKPQTRDKKAKKLEEEHLTRDEKRARALQIPITVRVRIPNLNC
jgi:nuclear factor erythroid 2